MPVATVYTFAPVVAELLFCPDALCQYGCGTREANQEQFASVSTAPDDSPAPTNGARATRGRRADREPARRTITFVIAFLITVFALMGGYRMANDTHANYVYLHAVAKHTAWALSWLGESSELERARFYQGQEAQVREGLAAMAEGRQPPVVEAAMEAVGEPSGAPLTSWELYLYRTLLHRRELAMDEARFAQLEKLPGATIDSPEAHLAAVRERLAQVEQSVDRPEAGEKAQRVGHPDVLAALPDLRSLLDELDPNATPRDAFVATLQDAMERIEALREQQRAFLGERVDRMRDRVAEWGPTVSFTARGSDADRLDALVRELEQADAEVGADSAAGAASGDALRAEIDALRERQRALRAEGREQEFMRPVGFTFTVVPDCGAIPSMAIFAAAVLAFPCPWGRRLLGLLIGVPVLYAVNVGRLACLGYIGAVDAGGEVFTFVHEYVWQGVYIIFVVVVWLVWVKLLVSDKAPAGKASV